LDFYKAKLKNQSNRVVGEMSENSYLQSSKQN